MSSETPSTRRRSATVAMLVFAALGFVLLPLKAEGQRTAYVAFAIAFLVLTIVAAVLERRLHLSHRPGGAVSIGSVVGLGLIITSVGISVVETAALGALSGALTGAASMILLETRSAGRG
jgi:hypothetical protein